MNRTVVILSSLAVSAVLVGCGGDGGDVHALVKQDGPKSFLFFGEVDPQGLGSLKNMRLSSLKEPTKALLKEDTSAIRYSTLSTSFEYDSATKSYSKLALDKLHYVGTDGKAYTVTMTQQGDAAPAAVQNSNASDLTKPSYKKVRYLGSRQYLLATSGGEKVLITPDMGARTAPILLGKKTLLSVTFPQYGKPVNGYLMYDSAAKQVQKCSTDLTTCTDIVAARSSRDFQGDVAGTAYSAVLSNGKLYRIDKSNGSSVEIALGKTIKKGHGTTSFKGGAFYFIATDGNLYKTDLSTKNVVKLTPKPDERLERIRAVTTDWIIAGSDTLLMALKKDGTSTDPIELVKNTQTNGYKYVTLGIGDNFLYVPYTLDATTGIVSYQACIFEKDGKKECKDNSFWAAVAAKRSGKLSLTSSYPYAPYAYIRVDDTDMFGGGTLKAIDPDYPMDEGTSLGKIANYNFQTFISGYRYTEELIDSEGGIVLYAKNDTNFHVDAFYMNLLQADSLKQLTNTDPKGFNAGPRDHCHGRHCMICHSFAGGKIYTDTDGKKSAYGYRIQLEFKDGTKQLADISKGKGENFSMPIEKIKGNFKAIVLNKNGEAVNHSAGYYHGGKGFADCNYCHARSKPLNDAPGTISIQ